VTSTVLPHDEPGSRTRHSWVRTALGVVAVTALIERGLIQQTATPAVLVCAALPALAFLILAVVRTKALEHRQMRGPSRTVIAASTVVTLFIAATGIASLFLAAS